MDEPIRVLRVIARPNARLGGRRPAPQPLTRALPDVVSAPGSVRTRGDRLRVLLFSQYFPPEVGATQTRMQAFAEFLAAQGHRVTVICEFPNHPHGVIPAEYRGRLVEDDRSNDYRVLRVWVMANETKTQRTRMTFYVSYMAMAALVAPLAGRADVVVATTPPLLGALAGAAVARLNLAPLVLDVRDLWPAAAVSLGQLSNPTAARAAELIERRLYREAAAVVAVTRPFCEHIDAIRRRPPNTVLLPNGTLPQFFVEGDTVTARATLKVPAERFLATFAGTLGIAQALPTLLDAAALARGELEFAVLGDGPMRNEIEMQARERDLHNVRFHGQVTLEEIPPLLAASDALIVSLSAHPTFETFVPSKLVDFLATGRPVVVAAAGEAARLATASGGGIAVPPERPEELLGALRWIRDHPVDAARMGERGRAWARTRLRSHQAERLEHLLLDVTSSA